MKLFLIYLHLLFCINPFNKILIVAFICQHVKKEIAQKNISLSFIIALLISFCCIPLAILCQNNFPIEISLIANICIVFSFLWCAYWQNKNIKADIFQNKFFFVSPLAFPLICGPNLIGVIFQYLTTGFSIFLIILCILMAVVTNFVIILCIINIFYKLPSLEFVLSKMKCIAIFIFICCSIYHLYLIWKLLKIFSQNIEIE
jgi:small neutral amino acid transporter SnatA (MarC family)